MRLKEPKRKPTGRKLREPECGRQDRTVPPKCQDLSTPSARGGERVEADAPPAALGRPRGEAPSRAATRCRRRLSRRRPRPRERSASGRRGRGGQYSCGGAKRPRMRRRRCVSLVVICGARLSHVASRCYAPAAFVTIRAADEIYDSPRSRTRRVACPAVAPKGFKLTQGTPKNSKSGDERTHPSKFYAFGPFVADARRRRLLRDGRAVTLTPKAFDMLLASSRTAGASSRRRSCCVWSGPTSSSRRRTSRQHGRRCGRRSASGPARATSPDRPTPRLPLRRRVRELEEDASPRAPRRGRRPTASPANHTSPRDRRRGAGEDEPQSSQRHAPRRRARRTAAAAAAIAPAASRPTLLGNTAEHVRARRAEQPCRFS